MMVFWAIVAVLVAITLAGLLPVLWRPHAARQTLSTASQASLYRQHLQELEQDRASGLLEPAQLPRAERELEQRILQETAVPVRAAAYVADRRSALLVCVLLPLLAISIYLKTGNPHAITDPLAQPVAAADQTSIEPILEKLRLSLQQDPSDGAGWVMLGKAYSKLHRYQEASQAYSSAVKAIPDDAGLLVDYAIALAFTNQRKLQGKPEQLIQQALALDPNYPKAMMLAASAAFDRKEYATAIGYWQRLLERLPAESEAAVSISKALAEAQALQQSGAQKSN